MTTVPILAEAGLSECARMPEVPMCKELNDELFLVFLLIIGLPALLIAMAVWILSARSATASIRPTAMSPRRKRAWSTASWMVPVLGPIVWGIRRVVAPAPLAPPPDAWSPSPRERL